MPPETVMMPRWIYGSVFIIYLAGTFGFGLAHQISGADLGIGEAMSYGAAWPWIMLHKLGLI